MRRSPWALLFALALVVHVVGLWSTQWPRVVKANHGRDFASYHYAVHAAAEGLDPYDKADLAKLASRDGTRAGVHPYFYPPPFLLAMAWVLPLELGEAYRAWFWIDALFLLAALWALWRMVPGPPTLLAFSAILLFFTPIPNSHVMGQANLPVLALIAWGLWQEPKRPVLGGALMGIACMLKMSPALLVAWWLIRGRFRSVAAACGVALVLSVMTLPLLGLEGQLRFYTEVLPGFGSGDYNGLTVPIDLFGNHSIPNLWALAFPGKGGLSVTARMGASVSNLVAVGLALWFARRPGDRLGEMAAAGLIVVVMCVVPVYAYEHHFTLLVIPLTAAFSALGGRMGRGWIPALVLAFAALAYPLHELKGLSESMAASGQVWPAAGLRELKFIAALVLGAACARAVSLSRGRRG